MRNGAELQDQIEAIFRDGLNLEVTSVDTDILDNGLLDSLALVEFLLHLEIAFDLTVTPDQIDFDNFRSIARIAEFTATRLAQSEASTEVEHDQ